MYFKSILLRLVASVAFQCGLIVSASSGHISLRHSANIPVSWLRVQTGQSRLGASFAAHCSGLIKLIFTNLSLISRGCPGPG